MEDSISIIFATIVAIVLVFLFPMLDVWERQDDLSYMTAYSQVVDFVDSVRNIGYMTNDMYSRLRYTLGATGNSYDIEMEHRRWTPVSAGSGKYEQVYISYYTPQIESKMNSDENGRYNFNKGDYFYLSIKNTNKTQATIMKQFLYGTLLQTFKVGVPYGGMIRNNPTL